MYLPNHTGHRALQAIANKPLFMVELRAVVCWDRPATSLAKVAGYEADGLICRASKFSKWVLTDIGREALAALNAGGEWAPFRTSVRLFVSSQGGAGANNLRAEG